MQRNFRRGNSKGRRENLVIYVSTDAISTDLETECDTASLMLT